MGALAAYCDALSGVGHARTRLDAAHRCRALAEAAGDPVGLLLALRLAVVARLELGDFATADVEVETYERAADATGVPLYQWLPPIWRATRAVMRGDIAEAWRHIARADDLGRRAGSENADMMVLSARINIHLSQGSMPELMDEIRPIAGLPWASAAGGAWLFHQGGDIAAAARMLAALTIADIRVDSEWAPSVWAAGLTAIELGDLVTVRDSYDALAPYADLWIVDGIGGGVYGVTADGLGRFAAALDEPEQARHWLTSALATYQAAGAVLLAASAEQALIHLPALSTMESGATPPVEAELAELVHEGRTWRVSFRGRTATVADSKGIRDLAALLAVPGREVHVLDLADATGTARATSSDTGEALDATARAAYRARLTELADELVAAESDGDLGRAERIRDEHGFLVAELAGALGLRGKGRITGDPAEKARKAVTMRIGTALRALDDIHPVLARHLRLAIGTGRFCAYRPEQAVRWTIRAG